MSDVDGSHSVLLVVIVIVIVVDTASGVVGGGLLETSGLFIESQVLQGLALDAVCHSLLDALAFIGVKKVQKLASAVNVDEVLVDHACESVH